MKKPLIMPSNPVYRIGDIIYRRYSWKKERKIILSDPKYKETLLFSYLSKLKDPFDETNKILRTEDRCLGLDSQQAFKEAIEENFQRYEKYLLNTKNTLYANIRAGDVIDLNKNKLLINNPKPLYDYIERKMQENELINKIRIVTALHFGDQPNNNPQYRYQFSKKSEDKNIECIEKIINYLKNNLCEDTDLEIFNKDETNEYNIDKDFYILSYAENYFLEEFGGFTKAIEDSRLLIRNNKIEDFSKPKLAKSELKKQKHYLEKELQRYVDNPSNRFGFFALCSIHLFQIVQNIKNNLPTESIKFKQCKINQQYRNKNIREIVFQNANTYIDIESLKYGNYIIQSNNIFYKNIDGDKYKNLIKKYFKPKNEIEILKNLIIKDLNLDTNKTLSVYYRGTDTTLDRGITYYNVFTKKVKDIIRNHPNIQSIYLQTDDKMFEDYFVTSSIDKKILINPYLKSTYSSKGQHFTITENFIFHIQKILATVLMMSECKYVFCNTSNVSRWIHLYMRDSEGFYQMKDNKIFPEISG